MKITLRTTKIYGLFIFLGSLCMACEEEPFTFQTVLNANFETYQTGASGKFLIGNIPGFPDSRIGCLGDQIQNAFDAVIVDDVNPALPTNVLNIHEQVDFLLACHESPDYYQITWSGIESHEHLNTSTRISFMNAREEIAFVIVLEAGTFSLLTGKGDVVPKNSYTNSLPHFVNIFIDNRGIPSFEVTFEQLDEDIEYPIEYLQLPYLNNDVDQIEIIRIESTPQAEYYIDDLRVIARTDS